MEKDALRALAGGVVPVRAGGADLHMHTTASDGTLAPAAMVALCKEQGLEAIGITDHDTAAGLAAARDACTALGIRLVPGVELSCEVPGAEVHILGYLCDFDDGPLADLLRRMREGRIARAAQAVEQLRRAGFPIELSRVMELGQESVGRPHIAAALVEAGYADSVRAAFDRFLVRGRPGYAPRPKLSPIEAITTIRDAGGVPVVAHPGLIGDDKWVTAFIEAGALGLEAYHSDHNSAQAAKYARWAEEKGLLVTGGSDSHGAKGARPVLPGNVRVTLNAVDALFEAARA